MNNSAKPLGLMHYFMGTLSPLGRWWTNIYAQGERWLWRIGLAGGPLAKRAFDLLASVAFLVLFSPLYLIIALLVKLEDRGPVIFTQTRVGHFGRGFTCLRPT